MNRKLVAMSALPLMLSMSFVNQAGAEDVSTADTAGIANQKNQQALESSTDTGAKHKMLGEVVVSATRSAKSVQEVPVTTFVINEKKIEGSNASGIEELVKRIPGVVLSRNRGLADSAPGVSLRGVPGSARSLVMLDGIPVNDGYAGSQKTMGFSVDDIQKVEVILGPASSLYGNNAMGGVVSYYSRMPEKREFRYRMGFGDTASGKRGVANQRKLYVSYGDKFASGLKLLATGSRVSADGYVGEYVTRTTAPAGVTGYQNSTDPKGNPIYVIGEKGRFGTTNGQFAMRGEYELGGMDKLSLSVNQGTQENSNVEYPTTYMTNTATGATNYTPAGTTFSNYLNGPSQTKRVFTSAGIDKQIGASMVKVKLGHTRTDYWYLTSFTAAATWSGGAAQRVWNPSQSTFLEAQVFTPLTESHVLTWGATRQNDTAEAYRFNIADWRNPDSLTGAMADRFAGRTDVLGVFLQDEWSLMQGTSIYIGARVDNWKGSNGSAYQATPTVSAAFPTRTASAISPRLSIVHKPNSEIALRASMGSAFRAANVFELYRPFPASSATGTYTGNNPNLNPEKMKSIDFGADAALWDGALIKASVYFNYFTDMIYNKPITSLADAQVACPGIVAANFNTASGQKCQQKTNVGSANNRGLELILSQAMSHSVSGWISGTWMRSEITKNDPNPSSVGKRFTQVPHKTAGAGLDYESGAWSSSISANYKGRQYSSSDDANTQTVWGVWTAYDAYTTVDAKVIYRVTHDTKLSVSVDNLFNKDAFSYYRISGRSWLMELSGNL